MTSKGKGKGRACHEPMGSERTPLLCDPAAPTSSSAYHGDCRDAPHDAAAAAADDDEGTVVAQELPLAKLILVMSTAYLGVFLGALDSTIIATLSAPISSEFHSLSLLSWLATGYLIANAVCQPIAGRLTDIFGRRVGLTLSNFLFAVGNLICGLATNTSTMIFGRVIAGIGGGGMISIATFLTSDLTPLNKRGIMQGVANLWFGAGAMLGAVIGGLLHDYTRIGWRLAFLIQVPPALLLVPGAWFLINVPPKQSEKTYLSRIDFGGVLLTASFLVLLLLGLSTGGTLVPWTHPLPLTTLPLSLLAFAAFLSWEYRAKQPIIPVRFLGHRTIISACLASLFISMILMTTTFYIPLYLQVLGDTAATAGVKILPAPLGGSVGALGVGYGMAWTGGYRRFGILGGLALMVGCVLFTLLVETSDTVMACAGLFLVNGGYSVVLATATVASLAAVDHAQQAPVTSAIFLARSVGGTVGIALASTGYQNTLRERLWDRFGTEAGAADEIHRILNGLEELKHLPDGWWDGTISAFIEAFRVVWVMMACWAVLALVSISLVKKHKLHTTLDRS